MARKRRSRLRSPLSRLSADSAPANAQISDGFYYLQPDKPRRKKRPAAQKPPDPNAAIPPGTASPAQPRPERRKPHLSLQQQRTARPKHLQHRRPRLRRLRRAAQRNSGPAPATPAPAEAAPPKTAAPAKPEAPSTKRSDPKLADVLDALTGPDDAKFEALLNPAPRPGEKPLGQPIETSPATETGTISVPPPLGPDIETSATAATPAAPESEAAGGRTERGVIVRARRSRRARRALGTRGSRP